MTPRTPRSENTPRRIRSVEQLNSRAVEQIQRLRRGSCRNERHVAPGLGVKVFENHFFRVTRFLIQRVRFTAREYGRPAAAGRQRRPGGEKSFMTDWRVGLGVHLLQQSVSPLILVWGVKVFDTERRNGAQKRGRSQSRSARHLIAFPTIALSCACAPEALRA